LIAKPQGFIQATTLQRRHLGQAAIEPVMGNQINDVRIGHTKATAEAESLLTDINPQPLQALPRHGGVARSHGFEFNVESPIANN